MGYQKGRKEERISNSTLLIIQEKKEIKLKMETSVDELRARCQDFHRQKSAEVKRTIRQDKRAWESTKRPTME